MSATDDQTHLYSLAVNCTLYEEDPQPALQNVGTSHEPRLVSPIEAWRSYYSRYLASDFEADRGRVEAAMSWAQDERRHSKRRKPGAQQVGTQDWDCAIELCDRALTLIRESGADTDPFARKRLLAGLSSALTIETLGVIPGVAEDAGKDLAEALAAIDAEEQDGTS